MVAVLDRKKRPLAPCSEKRARQLLERGRAVVYRIYPVFTIRLKDRLLEECGTPPVRLKVDPGAKTSGFSLLREDSAERATVVHQSHLVHREDVKDRVDTRRACRRGRRNRHTWYREPRFNNRPRVKCRVCGRNARKGKDTCREHAGVPRDLYPKEVWLPPSLKARLDELLSWVRRYCRIFPVSSISVEWAKFDTQKLQNPEISGVEYQHGTLFGYEVKEYLLEKWGRKCAYCGAENVPLEVEHVVPRNPKRGPKGTDRISNLTLSCKECNDDKGNKQPEEWLEELKKSGKAIDRVRAENLPKVLAQLEEPLKEAAFMNAVRYALVNELKKLGFPLELGTAAQTKKNRLRLGLPKLHCYDAACVGESTPATINGLDSPIAVIRAVGRGTRRMCNTDAYGFPVGHRGRKKLHYGFMTNDLVAADVPSGKYAGRYVGFVAVRASGYFDIKDVSGHRLAQGVSWKHCWLIQRFDGYTYGREVPAHSFPQ
ncbi:HNH endonuclease [Desulfofundulus sp. TPOSR]|uniref:RNA-guided endonuclease IscB n=1 Tax=Desulfofundulus sp. TPOSR TaxID=2714340 RepID=UPI00140E9433|nr:RNA-guided endonuclease IscB [Desulfofundulus sp. TPOSR]NHM27984.1 HNH endonuclease [Desulfofundulus sp. TPOSR]